MRGLHSCFGAIAAVLLALSACSDSTKPRQEPPVTISGTVLDADGAPVVGASILLQHAYEPVPDGDGAKPQTGVEFVITEPDTADIWITFPCTGDTVRVVVRQYPLMAGRYTILWSGRDRENRRVGDALYRLHLLGLTTDLHVDFVYARDDWADLADGEPVAALDITDSDGSFSIDTACMPFGFEFGNPGGRTLVTHSIRLWAVVPGQSAVSSDWLTVDAEDGAEVVIAPTP